MSERIIAVLGLGSIGLRHAGNIIAAGCSVVGFDPDPARRRALVEIGGMAAESRESAITAAEAVVLATPTARHFDDFSETIRMGRHVFVEKPLSDRTQGLKQLLESAARKDLVIALGFNLRFHPAVHAARNLLHKDSIGTLLWARFIGASYLPDWRPGHDYRQGYAADPTSGGAIFDWSHELDLSLYLLGPATVAGASSRSTGAIEIASEDCADILLRHASGTITSIHLDYVTRPAQRHGEICGTAGTIKLDLLSRSCRVVRPNGDITDERQCDGSFDEDYRLEIQDFLNCIISGSTPRCSGGEGLEALEIAIAARGQCGLPSA